MPHAVKLLGASWGDILTFGCNGEDTKMLNVKMSPQCPQCRPAAPPWVAPWGTPAGLVCFRRVSPCPASGTVSRAARLPLPGTSRKGGERARASAKVKHCPRSSSGRADRTFSGVQNEPPKSERTADVFRADSGRREDAFAVLHGSNREHIRGKIGAPSGFRVSLCPCVCPVFRPRFRRVASGHGEARQAWAKPEMPIKKGASVAGNP